jgi:carboxymethylenebutenolidase
MHVRPPRARTKRLSDAGVTPEVWGGLETPGGSGPYPGLILLGGSGGLHAGYEQVARSFAAAGFVAMTLDYLAETGIEPSPEERLRHGPLWQALVRNAVALLVANPLVSGRPTATSTRGGIGLVGYSLGAFLAVSVASSLPEVRAVVDFFGGGGGGTRSLDEEARGFPPLLILHGEADTIVPVSFARELRDAVIAHGGEVEMQIYPGAEHGFNAPWTPFYSEPVAADSFRRTIDFLARRLGKSG